MKKNLLSCFFFAFIVLSTWAQDVGIGEWQVYLPYRKAIAVDIVGEKVYCATPNSIFYYDKTDNSVNTLTKNNGLSDVNISTIRYSPQFGYLIVAYTNANIDLVADGEIINISDIKRKPIMGNKAINNITVYGDYAYLSCGFGIVVLDIARKEIKDTYYIGPDGNAINVLDLACDGIKFYAGTEKGLYYADYANANLANYANWKKESRLPDTNATYNSVAVFQGKVFANRVNPAYNQDTLYVLNDTIWQVLDTVYNDDVYNMRVLNNHFLIAYTSHVAVYNANMIKEEIIWNYQPGYAYPNCAVFDSDGATWIADKNYGLVCSKNWTITKITPNGPGNNNVFAMDIAGSDLYVAPGGVNNSWGNSWNNSGIFSYINNQWNVLKDFDGVAYDTLVDIIDLAIDPRDNTHVFAASLYRGVVELKNGYITNVYGVNNSALELPFGSVYYWLGIGGVAFDANNNLWAVNTNCNNLLKVRRTDGTWLSYSTIPYLSQGNGGKVMVDQTGQKWVLLMNGAGLLVFNENGTWTDNSDNVTRLLTTSVGNGNLPSNSVYSFAEDLDGQIWIGTDKGVAVFYDPENITLGGNFDAQLITVMQDGTAQHLLAFEKVTAIAVDGANKKWFGTENAGVFLMSEDGQEQLFHFTEDNSPLLSNTITSIAIDEKTGVVYFGTSNGLVSFRAYATKGEEVFTNVYAYPNPVRENFSGMIGIKGLVKDATVKITDISGTLVYETLSEGGQAVWNGKNFHGESVRSGVYFVFCSSEDCTEKLVTKIMVIN
ncbi:MAG TPA: two-component regulator propeller domain-containing protein [Bacteroidales bacterium]|nr:two-component regulator propeller domain-containing protein [Bacteroidales bacterium]